MATVTASHLVLRIPSSEMKGNLAQIALKNQIATHGGLRSVNKPKMLRKRTTATATATAISNRPGKLAQKYESGGMVENGSIEAGMSIIFVSTEVGPWSKTGGLGDVLGGLPPALAARGNRVMTVVPRYDQYKDAWDTAVAVELLVGDKLETVRFFHCYKRGVDRVFVDHPMFLEKVWGKTASKIYGPVTGTDYKDNQLRFSLLCLAALEIPRILNLTNKYFSGPYGEDVLFIANDWHTALLPCYLKSMYQSNGIYKNAKVVFCIHNIAYQGRFKFSDFSLLNLPERFKSSFDFIDGSDKPVKGRKINWMKAAIMEADTVLTVSPYYAMELVSGPDKGCELDNPIRLVGIKGIVNGMDVQEWNPETDKYLSIKYNAETVKEAKALLKEALQAELGLPVDRNIPLMGFVGRLEEQKGSDILVAAIPKFIKANVQVVILVKSILRKQLHVRGLTGATRECWSARLAGYNETAKDFGSFGMGTGKKHLEKEIKDLETLYPDYTRGVAEFNVRLAHLIFGASNFFLVPSRFEPCGLIQLQAMRYGTVPIVVTTGGLVDTVKEGFTGFHIGAFNVECEKVDPADVNALATNVTRALATYGTAAHEEMVQNCMAQDHSWKEPSRLWENMLLNLGVSGSKPGFEGDEIAPSAKENIATP